MSFRGHLLSNYAVFQFHRSMCPRITPKCVKRVKKKENEQTHTIVSKTNESTN